MRVLVTGASGGIGSATARVFETAGHTVLRHDVRPAIGIDIAGDLLQGEALEEVKALCKRTAVDTVVTAHGLAGPSSLPNASTDLIHRTMRINTISVIALYDALQQDLVDRAGAFVAISSQAGLHAEAQNAIYSASKFAVVGWAEATSRLPVRPRMRVICPGMTETPLLVSGLQGMATAAGVTYEQFLAMRLEYTPLGRLGRPEEIGQAALWAAELETDRCVVAAITGGAAFE